VLSVPAVVNLTQLRFTTAGTEDTEGAQRKTESMTLAEIVNFSAGSCIPQVVSGGLDFVSCAASVKIRSVLFVLAKG
jgi:hypothetical protein